MGTVLLRTILHALSLLLIANLVPGFQIANFYIALVVVIVLGIVNALIKPILVLLTLPITIVTFGLFLFLINLFLFWFVSTFIKGFQIANFSSLLLAWLLYSLLGLVMNTLLRPREKSL